MIARATRSSEKRLHSLVQAKFKANELDSVSAIKSDPHEPHKLLVSYKLKGAVILSLQVHHVIDARTIKPHKSMIKTLPCVMLNG